MRNLVGAPLPENLAREALQIVNDIRIGKLGVAENRRIVDVVSRMTSAVMHHFFVEPLELLSAGLTLRKLAEVGVNSAAKGIHYGLGRIIPKLRKEQLAQLADFLDASLYESGAKAK